MRQLTPVAAVVGCVLAALISSCSDTAPTKPEDQEEVKGSAVFLTFADSSLAAAVDVALASADGMTDSLSLAGLTDLDASGQGIVRLDGIQQLHGLQSLNVADNSITDITPLSGLAQLRSLDLTRNGVTDVEALAQLNNLEIVLLGDNDITDILPLGGLRSLAHVDLSGNPVAIDADGSIAALRERNVTVELSAGKEQRLRRLPDALTHELMSQTQTMYSRWTILRQAQDERIE